MIEIYSKCETFRVVAIYRPPKPNHAVSVEEFDSFHKKNHVLKTFLFYSQVI